MKKNNKTFVVNPIIGEQRKKNPTVLRVILSELETRIDFGYAAPWIYVKGGWITIAPYTFIEVKCTGERFALTNATNIPYAPQRHDFQSKEDWCVFSLYFEPLPIKDCIINIVEEEKPDTTDFNYYDIVLKDVNEVEMIKN
jgi:hypothetical protein